MGNEKTKDGLKKYTVNVEMSGCDFDGITVIEQHSDEAMFFNRKEIAEAIVDYYEKKYL